MPGLLFLGLLMISDAHACDHQQIKLNHEGFEVTVAQYLTDSNKHIIIIPPTGGINFLDRSYAKNFCQAGFNAHVIERWSDDDEYNLELSIHTRFYARAQRAIEATINSLSAAEFIGMLGTSVGGLHTAVAVGRLEQINAAFVITAGADIAEVIVTSEQQAMVDAKEKRIKMYSFKNEEEYLQKLRPNIVLEPLKFDKHKAKHLGMVYASADTVVPAKNQKLLMDLWQPQKVIEMSNNHMWSIIKSWLFYQDDIIRFFKTASSSEDK